MNLYTLKCVVFCSELYRQKLTFLHHVRLKFRLNFATYLKSACFSEFYTRHHVCFSWSVVEQSSYVFIFLSSFDFENRLSDLNYITVFKSANNSYRPCMFWIKLKRSAELHGWPEVTDDKFELKYVVLFSFASPQDLQARKDIDTKT